MNLTTATKSDNVYGKFIDIYNNVHDLLDKNCVDFLGNKIALLSEYNIKKIYIYSDRIATIICKGIYLENIVTNNYNKLTINCSMNTPINPYDYPNINFNLS